MTAQKVNRLTTTIRIFVVLFIAGMLSLSSRSVCHATSITLQWDPVPDPDLAGYRVYYKADTYTLPFNGTGASEGPSPLDIQAGTVATINGLDPAHTYYFAVTSYKTTGEESTYSGVVMLPDSVAPTVAISSPVNAATVSGAVAVSVNAADTMGVTSVELYVNGTLTATSGTVPCLFSWNATALPPGAYTLTAKAYDAAGNMGLSATTNVTVTTDTTPPIVVLTSPPSNTVVSGGVTVSAIAADTAGVSLVEFYENSQIVAAFNTPPYSFTWNSTTVANGAVTLTARAYDTSGNMRQSAGNTVTVSNNSLVQLNDNGTVSYFQTLTAAYLAAVARTNVVISLQAGTLTEAISFNQNFPVKLVGGYDATFTNQIGSTAVSGPMTISNGVESISGISIY